MKILSGEIVVAGRLAYVPQQPWIVSASLRDNILLGNDLDQDRWAAVYLSIYLKSQDYVDVGAEAQQGRLTM